MAHNNLILLAFVLSQVLLFKLHSQVESVMLGVGMAVPLLEIIHEVRAHTARWILLWLGSHPPMSSCMCARMLY